MRPGRLHRSPGFERPLAGKHLLLDRPRIRAGGAWFTQLFPFLDSAAFEGFRDFETAVYENY